MGRLINCINYNRLSNGCSLAVLGMDLFCHAFQVRCLVNLVLYAKIHGPVHNLGTVDPCEFFNVMELIPDVPGFIITDFHQITFYLTSIRELSG